MSTPKRRLTVGDFDWIHESLATIHPKMVRAHKALAKVVVKHPEEEAELAFLMLGYRLREMKTLLAELEKAVKHYE